MHNLPENHFFLAKNQFLKVLFSLNTGQSHLHYVYIYLVRFNNNGGPAAVELSSKVAVLRRNLSSKLGLLYLILM